MKKPGKKQIHVFLKNFQRRPCYIISLSDSEFYADSRGVFEFDLRSTYRWQSMIESFLIFDQFGQILVSHPIFNMFQNFKDDVVAESLGYRTLVFDC